MYGQTLKIDPQKVLKLKHQGLSSALIAQRLGVSYGTIYQALQKRGRRSSTKAVVVNLKMMNP